MGGFYWRSAVLNTVVKTSALLSHLKLVAHPISPVKSHRIVQNTDNWFSISLQGLYNFVE